MAWLFAALLALLAAPALALVTVPGIFSDGMVLQEHDSYDQRPMIYGASTSPNELVTVIRARPSGHNDTYLATSEAVSSGGDGLFFWIVQLDPDYFPAKDNNLTIYISGSVAPVNLITIRDVVYGDVFLCVPPLPAARSRAACPPLPLSPPPPLSCAR
jgi:hypothetical protein